nr:penicillin-binding transpeptidase domain-containing protein [Marinicella sp. W31]MDC2879856.1 penicillin-binding transpeptidase domain-containing protein [Marinicella sp. W31]
MVADVTTGAVLVEEGDCRTRVTPASTFKLPLAVMGYDAGFLRDADHPVLAFREGDPDWGGFRWRRDTDPADWIRYSVVWYSQRITHALGAEALTDYAEMFAYGNADFGGDPGYNNGLDRAWIASSLQISPYEQVRFLRALVLDALPVGDDAMTHARELVEFRAVDGWMVHGKTGAAYPAARIAVLIMRGPGAGMLVGRKRMDGRWSSRG